MGSLSTVASLRLDPPVTHASRVLFVRNDARERMVLAAERARALVARVGPVMPGGLMRVLDGAVEGALARRGAMPAVALPDGDPRIVVADQIFRTVTLPARGLLICMPSLAGIAEAGRLREDDARAALAWIDAARGEHRLALTLLFDHNDVALELRVPRTLSEIIGGSTVDAMEDMARSLRPVSETPKPPKVAPTLRPPSIPAPLDTAGAELSIPDLAVPAVPSFPEELTLAEAIESTLQGELALESPAAAPEMSIKMAMTAVLAATDVEDSDQADLERPTGIDVAASGSNATHDEQIASVSHEFLVEIDAEAVAQAATAHEAAKVEIAAAEAAAAEAAAEAVAEAAAEAHIAAEKARLETERDEADRAQRMMQQATWRTHALELDAAKGPRPAAQIEKLFVEHYVPLLSPFAMGQLDNATRDLMRTWRDGFCDSYESAFTAIRMTSKRPPMVMDAPEVAHRIARLASARSVKLVMIDGMSLDLGTRVSRRLAAVLDKRALLVEKNVLWAALPSTTNVQLHLLGKGPSGFSDIPSGPDSEIQRGRSVGSFRRERLGGRELLRLDIVEARLRQVNVSYEDCLETLADEICEALLKLFEALPPRTLVYLFGDHGFSIAGSKRQAHGGSSPEEVLVAGHAWLTDSVQ